MSTTDPPYTKDQLEELAKLAPRVDRPDAAERFKRAMRQLFGSQAPVGEPCDATDDDITLLDSDRETQ